MSLCYSILLEDDSAFVDFAPLKVYKGKECLQVINGVYCDQVCHNKVLFGGGNFRHQLDRTILPDLIKTKQLRLVSFPNWAQNNFTLSFSPFSGVIMKSLMTR